MAPSRRPGVCQARGSLAGDPLDRAAALAGGWDGTGGWYRGVERWVDSGGSTPIGRGGRARFWERPERVGTAATGAVPRGSQGADAARASSATRASNAPSRVGSVRDTATLTSEAGSQSASIHTW